MFVDAKDRLRLAIAREAQLDPRQGEMIERLYDRGSLVLASFGFGLLFLRRFFNLLLRGVGVGED